MRKNFIYILMAGMSLALINACDINEFPETQVSTDKFWNTASDVRMAANYFYTTLPGLSSSEVEMDVWSSYGYSNSGSGTGISDGSRVAPMNRKE